MSVMAKSKRLRERRLCLQPAPKGHVHLALTLLYAGTAFRGLQLQTHSPTHHTVEGVLLQALRDVGVLDALVCGKPACASSAHLARACRTDRGVHAIRNVVSLFVRTDAYTAATATAAAAGEAETALCARINAALPASVRVACVTRVMGNFMPRHCCNRRVYRYLLPAYALLPPCDSWPAMAQRYPGCVRDVAAVAAAAAAVQRGDGHNDDGACAAADAAALPYVDLDVATADDTTTTTATTTWRDALAAAVARCNALVREHYIGAHRFHNFTVDASDGGGGGGALYRHRAKQVDANDEAAMRVIYRCEVAPRVYLLAAPPTSSASTSASSASSWSCAAGGGVSYAEYLGNCAVAELTPATRTATVCSGGDNDDDDAAAAMAWSHLPFVVFQVEGASFLFNMIRKMVGAMVAVCRGARAGLLHDALSPQRRVCTPLAPAAYLMLASSSYQPYDVAVRARRRQQQKQQQQQQQQQQHEHTATQDASACARVARVPFCTLRRAMSGRVAVACERFARDVVYRDVVDADAHALPPLDDLLAARDAARRRTRPQWLLEDSHLTHSGDDQTLQHDRHSNSNSKKAVTASTCSAMTAFLRALRVHNWAVRDVALPADSKAMREVANRKRRARDGDDTTAEVTGACGDGDKDSNNNNDGDNNGNGDTDEDDDGWLYMAATTAEARAQCRAHAAAVRRGVAARHTRAWQHTTTTTTTTTNDGDDDTSCLLASDNDDDDNKLDDAVVLVDAMHHGGASSSDVSSSQFLRAPVPDYYKLARRRARTPMACPVCGRVGQHARRVHELLRRLDSYARVGVAFCHRCHSSVTANVNAALDEHVWYCTWCEICICPRCQR